ncbi:glycoside hydrolase family 18 protein [Chaetomium tenue]|uniref:Glycoside hydrolase family 18 protein n=1 Tax=Chaetomium tenue TaxID=1854479 RepID=A0ACB7NVB7_9PEZI|nr:glycoside hydrolase family 18 protein [Chaetomium globosum]
MGATYSYNLVQPGDGCDSLATRCGITGAQFTEYNPDPALCSTLAPRQPVYCSSGPLPNVSPQPSPDGACAVHVVQKGDTCSDIANNNYITVDDIEQWNLQTWGWEGCRNLQLGPICISTGAPPMPPAVDGVVCGPQVLGTTRPASWSDITMLNPCPLNACCDKWGQCGITPDFCTPTQSSTGAPGTSAPGTNGCISNCGTSIVQGSASGGPLRIGYFEVFGVDRSCLTMDASNLPSGGYTHVHYAFGSITSDFQVDLSAYLTQFEIFASMTGFKRILSFGVSSLDSAPIFRNGVTRPNRQAFAQSVVDAVRQYNLDGVDFDWEYPGAPDVPGTHVDDGQNYFEFLQTIRALLPDGVSLSIAAPASYWYLKGFPIAEISQVVDYVVYMTYDLHGQWDYNKTGANPGCPNGNCLRSHINVAETEYALAMITKAGVPANKVAVGIASYGRSFGMANPGCTGPECLFHGPASTAEEGPCTGTAGYISQAEIDALTSGNTTVSRLLRRGAITTWYDKESDSDMMTYGSGTWVAYMSPATKMSRIDRYAGYGFAGSVEWAVDLAQFVLGQDETHNTLSVAQLESQFTAGLALSNYDTSLFHNYNLTDLATRLEGFKGCNGAQQRAIYSGWQQSWELMNLLYHEARGGIDLNSAAAVEYLGPPAFSKPKKSLYESIFINMNGIQPGWWFNPFQWSLPVRCDDPQLQCPCGGRSDTMAYTIVHDANYKGNPSINFCPSYFSAPTLSTVMEYANTTSQIEVIYADMHMYDPNQALVWYHELLHVDWASGVSTNPSLVPIVDLRLGIRKTKDVIEFKRAYGLKHVKALARFSHSPDWTIKNADSMALYALARYVQHKLGNIYPHLPLAGNPPATVGYPFEVPGYFTIEADVTAELEPGADWEYPLPDSGTRSECDGVIGESASDNAVTLSANFAVQSNYPAEYLSSYSSWASLTPTTTSTAPTAPSQTWHLSIYSKPDCAGDYYSLSGTEMDSPFVKCLALRGGLPRVSDTGPTCSWFTGGGGVWADCSASYLTQPRSWAIRGGTCTAYGNTDCHDDGHSQAYTWTEGCHNYDAAEADTKNWLAVRCGAVHAPDDAVNAHGTPTSLVTVARVKTPSTTTNSTRG